MDNSSVSDWEGATQLVPFGADSFGVWLFLVIAIVAFVAVIVRAVQHERTCLNHVVDDVHEAESNGEVAQAEEVVAAATAV